MAELNADHIHAAAVAAWKNLVKWGPPLYGPPLSEELDDEAIARQVNRLSRLLDPGPESPPQRRPQPRSLGARRTVSVSNTTGAGGFVIATHGPLPGPLIVLEVAISTDVPRATAGSGVILVAYPADLSLGLNLDAHYNAGIPILTGQPDSVGTQWYAPGPTGQTAYFTPQVIVPHPEVFFRAAMQNGDAVARYFGMLVTFAALDAEELALMTVPLISVPRIQYRSYRTAPLPRPRTPTNPRAVLVRLKTGVYGEARRVIPFERLDPALRELATDPVTGEWRGTNGLEAVW